MNSDYINRLSHVIRTKKLSVAAFAREIGMEQVTVNNYMLEKRRLSLDFITNILSAYPDISAEWLMRGEGDMIKSETPKAEPHADFPNIIRLLEDTLAQKAALEAKLAVYEGQKGILVG